MSPAPLSRDHVVELATAAAFFAHQLRQFAKDTAGAEAEEYTRRAALLRSLARDLTSSETLTLSGGLVHA